MLLMPEYHLAASELSPSRHLRNCCGAAHAERWEWQARSGTMGGHARAQIRARMLAWVSREEEVPKRRFTSWSKELRPDSVRCAALCYDDKV